MNKILQSILYLIAFVFVSSSAFAEFDVLKNILKSEQGEWVKMKNPGGLVTTSLVTHKGPDFLILEVHTYRRKKAQSWVEQVYNLKTEEIVRCRIKYPDGFIEEVPLSQIKLWLDLFKNKEYEEVASEEVKVPAGKYDCIHYRAIVNDNLVHVWFSQSVPLTGMVKSRFRGGSSVLLDSGKEGVLPVF